MTESQKIEYDRISLEIRGIQTEITKISRRKGISILDMKKGFDLLQKEADLVHSRNHIKYPELDAKCKCGYKSPK